MVLWRSLPALVVLLGAPGPAGPSAPPPYGTGHQLVPAADSVPTGLERARWLAGCWRREGAGRVVDEQWMEPLGTAMLGMSRTVRDGRVVEYEHLRIEARGGSVFYVALPSRQSETEFEMDPGSDSTLVFENPEHDFPTRISYVPVGPDSLVATISGGGREIPFPFGRVACPGAAGLRPVLSHFRGKLEELPGARWPVS